MLPKNLSLHLFVWFWVILSFIILSLFLIIRASGYVINIKAKTLEKTGLVVVASDPKGALLYLNGKFHSKTPAKLNYLRPSLYHLKIEKESYQAWEKTEKVEAGKFLKEEAVLFLKKPEIQEAASDELERVMKEKEETNLSEQILGDLPKDGKDFSWDKIKKSLLYRTDSEIWLYYPDKPEKERNKIVARFLKPIKKVVFYPDFKHILFVYEGQLKILETSGENETKLLDLPSLDFWVSFDGRIVFFKDGDKFKKAKVR